MKRHAQGPRGKGYEAYVLPSLTLFGNTQVASARGALEPPEEEHKIVERDLWHQFQAANH